MSLFYAYFLGNHDGGRWVVVFETREVADEWWREDFTGKREVRRISPQLYRYEGKEKLVGRFYLTDEVETPRKERMFFVQLNRPGPGVVTLILPSLCITDHISGNT
ncbi:hypothetical protein BJ138DRAFT_261344 [Hygrophoropsis aurantiaca]|uniref:Uncharacterized protein n=1 Tax=Hygrophoropsis aurantiaca TaxID=72124 RepID=A0ACB7ZPV9_9AGAM|nr:hypothetical protein BJ138DRAFT_261344 [Hygrophoropsis aurantiaca]